MRRRFFSSVKDEVEPLNIEPLEDGLTLHINENSVYLYYSIDGREWNLLRPFQTSPEINKGQLLRIKSDIKIDLSVATISIDKNFKISGNVLAISKDYMLPSFFSGCETLVEVSKDFLPATTLTDYCYIRMFNGCTNLTTAPELPATTLKANCYHKMFEGCSKLNYIKMLATDISATNCLLNWVNGVASTGTFVKNPNMNSLPTGDSGIPSGWTVVNDGEESGGG